MKMKFFSLLLNCQSRLSKTWNGRIAFKLLCRVQRTNKEHISSSFLDRAEVIKLQHDGFEGTVYKLGSGEKNLLFLHGWKSHSARWTSLVEQLDLTQYTCYALDAPAHGRSSGNSLNLEIYRYFVFEIIKSVGNIEAMIGHSLGSLVTAYGYLCKEALPVNRFVISGAPAGMEAIYDFFKRVLTLDSRVIENMNTHISKNVTKIPAREINMAHFFKKVQHPTLVIHDEDDRVCPMESIKKAVVENPHLITFFTTGLGHDLNSKAVNDRIIQFIDQGK